jgi:predicted ATP-dependent serine protease
MRNERINLAKKATQTSIDSDLLVNYTAGSSIDGIFSFEGGLPKASNYMVTGPPGVAKSTCVLLYLSQLQQVGYNCLYVSSEMNRVDMERYFNRFPRLRELDILYLQGLRKDPDDLESEFYGPSEAFYLQIENNTYDVVALDSIAEFIEAEYYFSEISRKAIEKQLIEKLSVQNLKDHTSFLLVQQVTKSNQFAGSNRFKHIVHGMLELHFSGEHNSESRYMVFTKNRAGNTNQRLFYHFDKKGKLIFDERRFREEQSMRKMIAMDQEKGYEENGQFKQWVEQLNDE